MGAFGHISVASRASLRGLLPALLLVSSVVVATPAAADPAPDAKPAGPAEPAVSTSPEASAALDDATTHRAPRPVERRPALTRAAARDRVEHMSPVAWLSRFGTVEIGQPVAPAAPRP